MISKLIKTAFVSAQNLVINAFLSIVVKDEIGYWRLSKTLGGKVSRTKLTMEPWLVEKGSRKAYRDDAIMSNLPEIEGTTVLLFQGHGTYPDDILEVCVSDIHVLMQIWECFRENGFSPLRDIELRAYEENYKRVDSIVRRHTLQAYIGNNVHKTLPPMYFTYNEVLGVGTRDGQELIVTQDGSGIVQEMENNRWVWTRIPGTIAWYGTYKMPKEKESDVEDELVEMETDTISLTDPVTGKITEIVINNPVTK
jgi:hypothetical protein